MRSIANWMKSCREAADVAVVAIDGKTPRGSHCRGKDKGRHPHGQCLQYPINDAVLGQAKTDAKSNEITAIPELLKLLDLCGCLVTIDAMGRQKKIAQSIRQKGADYLLVVKENQPKLAEAFE